MFKPQVRHFSLFNRVPHARIVRSAARNGHEAINIQRVRIHKPFFSRSRMIGTLAVTAVFYGLTRYVSVEIVDDAEEEEEHGKQRKRTGTPISNEHGEEESDEEVEEDNEDEDEDEEYDDALIFLPTGFSRPRPQTYYRGTDPEWQEFVKVATDRPRIDKIRQELVTLIRTIAQKQPSYAARLGKIDSSKGNSWIEVKFPDGPPTEYERPGIELTEDLEWRKAVRPVEEMHHQRLRKLLYPSEASNALYEDTKRKLNVSWKSFKVFLGLESKTEAETVRDVIQRVVTDPHSAPTPAPSSNVPTQTSPATAAAETKQTTDNTPSPLDNAMKDFWFVLPDPKKLTLDLSQFRQDFKKATKPMARQAPRGTFQVLGLIEIHGDRAKMTLNVAAAYDPKQGKYVALNASIWNLRDHRQRPKGGP